MGIYTEHFNMTNKANNLAHHPQIITAPQDVESRLQGLTNLSLQDFAEIIQIANFARNDETANSTKTYAGTNFYHNLVKSLRNVLAAKGFTAHSHRNIELALHDNIAIGVCKGDEDTGNPNQTPHSAYKKGPVTLKLLGLTQDDNPQQGKLFSDTEKLHVTGGKLQLTLDGKERDVWVLVHYSIKNGPGDYQVQAELSQPATYDNRGYISSFVNRIILDFGQQQFNNAAPEFTDDIDFKIE